MKKPWSAGVITILVGVIIKTSVAVYGTDDEEPPGPVINPKGNEIILQKGQNFTLTCTGPTPVQFKQQTVGEEGFGGKFSMVPRNVTSDGNVYKTALDLYHVDQYAVGYYACFDETVNSSKILNFITEEPNNTEHVTYTYIYVNGTDYLLVPMGELVTTRSKDPVVIGCRPTMPDVQISLTVRSNMAAEYIKFSPKVGFLVSACRPPYQCNGLRGDRTVLKQLRCQGPTVPPPKITGKSSYFLDGETFSLNCTVPYQINVPVELQWDAPRIHGKHVQSTSNEYEVTNGVQYKILTIVNATKDDAGMYTCSSSVNDKKSFIMKYLNKPFIKLEKMGGKNRYGITEVAYSIARLLTNVDAYPEPKYHFLRNNISIEHSSKYNISKEKSGDVVLTITNLNVMDTANYTLVADNKFTKENVTYDLRVLAAPVVYFQPNTEFRRLLEQQVNFLCEATGYPLPNIRWEYTASVKDKYTVIKVNEFKVKSMLTIPVRMSENVTCVAENPRGKDSASRRLLVYELNEGFGITKSDTWYPVNQNVTLKCMASIYDFSNLTWFGLENLTGLVQYSESRFSHVAELKIMNIPLDGAGNFTCVGFKKNGEEVSQTTSIDVEDNRDIIFDYPQIDKDEEVSTYQPVQFNCQVDAVPPPHIEWYKDGSLLENNTDGIVIINYLEQTVFNSTIIISQMKEENQGKYECVASNQHSEERKFYNLILKDTSPYTATYIAIIGVVFIALMILVIYLTCKVRREKRLRKELAAAGLLYFKEGVTKSLNPDLVVDEQAELLPYDDRFEFPPEKLFLGKQLGAGAFGVVYKADARGIINAEETNTVAVKMVKKTADNMYIKALASELKIMVHLGKHINIVNLLGACTKHVGKRELIVIVEYCRFGNIHNYMQKHREVFIDQLTDSKEKNLGRVNRGYSSSSASSGMHSDYFGSNHTQATDHTFLNTANTTRSTRKVSDGYVQPEWRSNYESDYQSLVPRPLFSRDLLAWAFQIARGMEYLASRRVLHGDLAARNVLLADDNVVKICDFGLARSIYKNDEYQKKENSPLPVKWLAIECMTDRIFSTQSDVWSFGIVLWELFSLAKTPYPNMSPQSLLQYLTDGHRLEKPTYSDDRLYDVMRRCWEHKPTLRPSFTELQEILGSFLEDNVRNHYVDLNSSCMDMNAKNEPQEDYLAMMSSPDYNNLVTPSPHHYVNEVRSFFPPSPNHIPHDEEGYLQMTPVSKAAFSPMSASTKFDFDARRMMNTRMTEPSTCGSELTPMLTLNNLPARSGSESDHEGNHSPYLNMCPRIEEETDEVFETKANNIKNTQNSAVTNPTYITFDVDGEKKSQDFKNTYINMPNGLVK